MKDKFKYYWFEFIHFFACLYCKLIAIPYYKRKINKLQKIINKQIEDAEK